MEFQRANWNITCRSRPNEKVVAYVFQAELHANSFNLRRRRAP
ncbi:MAG: hypothetical protein U0235_33910 [Polyangiaceae bacterium]